MGDIKHYWENKDERAVKAKLHTDIEEKIHKKEIESSIKHTKIYNTTFNLPTENTELNIVPQIIVEDLDSVSAVLKYSNDNKTAVLNFSSYKNPGGGFLAGSKAQEECLCHESFLYNVLKVFQRSFYDKNCLNKNKGLYTNKGMYSPDIIFTRANKKDEGEKRCDVITCAAPNKTTAQKYQQVTDAENLEVLKSRMKFVLDIAVDNKVNTLILGAYGCGVFGQNPHEVASIFKELLTSSHTCFKKVIFAIPNGKDGNLKAFQKVFLNDKEKNKDNK